MCAPGIALDALPALDAMLLTHAHADHLSFDSLDRLPRDIPLYAPPAVARWLTRQGLRARRTVSRWREDQRSPAGAVRLHAERATHQGNRYGIDRWRSAANMYLAETDEESLFFAGDTALMPDTHALVERVLWNGGRTLDVALLPIGYAPPWKPGFRRGHLTHDDALALFETLRARALIPYHWGTFRHVTVDGARRHQSTACRADERMRSRDMVHIIEPGESMVVPPASSAA